jgi:hypothetical protein
VKLSPGRRSLHWLGSIGLFVVALIPIGLVTGFVGSLLLGSWGFAYAMDTPLAPAETTTHAATLAPGDESSEGSDPTRMDPISLIRSLGQLRDEGFLSDEAFEAKKAEILRRL